jgi:hypothetical protein
MIHKALGRYPRFDQLSLFLSPQVMSSSACLVIFLPRTQGVSCSLRFCLTELSSSSTREVSLHLQREREIEIDRGAVSSKGGMGRQMQTPCGSLLGLLAM